MKDKNSIGNRIKTIRGRSSQDAFAQEVRVSKMTVGRWERGERTPDADDLNRILMTYPDINPTWLLTGEGEMERFAEAKYALPSENELLAAALIPTSTSGKLTIICDDILEAQSMASFLGSAAEATAQTANGTELFGMHVCFRLLDEQINSIRLRLEFIREEVREHESHPKVD